MEYDGIIILGTSGAGKSTVAQELCKKYNTFQIIQAVTTRKPRKDNRAQEYNYISEKKFEKLDRENKLLIKTKCRGEYYGITRETLRQVIDNNKIPLLVLTPKSASELENNQDYKENDERLTFFTVFLDSLDNDLNERLEQRGEQVDKTVEEQRGKDREYKEDCLYAIKNTDREKTTELIRSLWEYRNTGGILPKRLIQLMIECGTLLENADIKNNITGAAYDLSLGDEYYYGGKIKTLSDKDPFVLIEPYDYAIVTSKEITNFPKDIAGRFDLSVSLFCQGIILSNGPQVDPGFRGRLFCLLFNTSNAPVFLKRGQHYATFEFNKLIEPTTPYTGKYQDKDKIIYYLPSNTMQGAINELKKELEKVRGESRNLQAIFLMVISLILAIIAIILALG